MKGGQDMSGEKEPQEKARVWRQPIAVFMILLSLITVGQGAYFTWDQRQSLECEARVNKQLLESQRQFRIEYEKIWTAILYASPPSRETNQKLFTEHINYLKEHPGPTAEDLEKC